MIPEYFAIVGAVIASLGGIYYLVETVRGKTKPNRVTWLLWGLFPMVIFVAQRAQGVHGLSWVSFAAGFTPFLVLIASFTNKQAYWKTQPRDYVLMSASVIAFIAWAITKNANAAILLSMIADFFAGLPTLIKALQHPETESWVAYAISSVGFLISILAIQQLNFQSTAFVVYLFTMNTLIGAAAARGKFLRSKTS